MPGGGGLGAAGKSAPRLGGVIGLDRADVVVWHDLRPASRPGGLSTLTSTIARFADRSAVARAAASVRGSRWSRRPDHRVPPLTLVADLVRPSWSRSTTSAWSPTRDRPTAVEAGGRDRRGACRVLIWLRCLPRSLPAPLPGRSATRGVAWVCRHGLAVVRRKAAGTGLGGRTSRSTSTWRASASPVPTCGGAASYFPAERRAGDPAPG
ncbi:hypothetical protein HBB16_21060 [Pseudonocardia sp. MCCB 268]|nr:hypothetical protein [Pseudonocardia cytotoxica]